ncbi:cysteine desulfurase family protein [Paenibacillus sepulcri]|uniref:Cysteine desulfurase n=1 Tax=Paenibacillus sepulcri TaxID=359917 RepID=A0ABS7BWY8_9BACL|nr:cysteine desulfurase [Paenibacillus sepulcri]
MTAVVQNGTGQNRYYFDYNASTPIDQEVLDEMLPYLQNHYGNPSSSHWATHTIKDAVDLARSRVAGLLGCKPQEIVFTSGGSESNNFAIKGAYFANRHRGNHIVTTKIEHPSVLSPCAFLESIGARVTYVDVDQYGRVHQDDIAAAIAADTILVSVMHANNETGTIQPLHEIAKITRSRGILLHSDAAQSAGKIAVKADALQADLITIAGHKMYAPKGIGALFVKEGTELTPHIHGANHESGRRAGTENVPYIVGLGKAAELAAALHDQIRIKELNDLLWRKLSDTFHDQIVLNGHPEERLPNTLNVSFIGKTGQELLDWVPEIAATTGSACHTGDEDISPVLKAMNVSPDIAAGTVRFSIGRYTTIDDIEHASALIKERLLERE